MFSDRSLQFGIGSAGRKKDETRSFSAELRTSGDGRKLVGYASVFNSESVNLGGYTEFVAPGAFSRSLRAKSDVVALLNHDPNFVLGRTSNNTLRLEEDSHGLKATIDPPPAQWCADLISSVKRGDIKAMSFGFRIRKDSWDTGTPPRRTLLDVDLKDVSIVTFPAYTSTEISSRSRGNNMNTTLKTLYDERMRVLTEQRKLLDNGRGASEEYQNLETGLEDLERKIKLEEREERTHERQNEPILPVPATQRDRDSDFENPFAMTTIWEPGKMAGLLAKAPLTSQQFKRAVRDYMTRRTTVDEVRRTLQADKDIVGGFLVMPEMFMGEMIRDLIDSVHMRRLSRNVSLPTAGSIAWPVLSDTFDDSNWTSELKTGSEDEKMDFEKMAFYPKPSAKRVKVSETLIRKAAIGIESLVRTELSYKFGLTEERAFLTGDGGGKPIGVFHVGTAGGLGITTARDVSTGNSATEIKADNLIDVKYSLKAQWRKNAVWLFHRDAIRQIRKLKTGEGDYLWKAGLSSDKPDTILDFPVLESEYVPNTFTTGQYVGILGDFRFYIIVTALDMRVQVLSELYAETGEVGYIGRMEVDGAPVRENAFARVTLA